MRHYAHIEKSAFHKGEYVGYLNGANRIKRYDKRGIWRMYYTLPDGNTHMIKGKLFEIEAHCAQFNGTKTHQYRKTQNNMTITDYTVTRLHNNDLQARYKLHLPPAHFANGTPSEIVQDVVCTLTFADVPFMLFGTPVKLVSIYNPQRFGTWNTPEEQETYLYNFVHDSTLKTDAR